MNSDQAASITALILNGVSKEQAALRWGSDEEFDAFWDALSADIERQRHENPGVQFDIPTSGL